MAFEFMKIKDRRQNEQTDFGGQIAEFTEILSAPGNGKWILVPAGAKSITTTLSFPSAGSGKIQTTTDSIKDVKEDNDVTAVDWPDVTVTVTTQNVCAPVTAIRQVNSSGTSKISLRAQ